MVLVLQGSGGEGVVGEVDHVDSGDSVEVTEVGGEEMPLEELVTMATVRTRMVVRIHVRCKVFQTFLFCSI